MMGHRVAIYIPSTTGVNKPAPEAQIEGWTKGAKHLFATLFGGYTAHHGRGGWVSPEHGLVDEPVTVIHSFTDRLHPEAEQRVRRLAALIAKDMGQESVSVEMNGGLHFINPEGK